MTPNQARLTPAPDQAPITLTRYMSMDMDYRVTPAKAEDTPGAIRELSLTQYRKSLLLVTDGVSEFYASTAEEALFHYMMLARDLASHVRDRFGDAAESAAYDWEEEAERARHDLIAALLGAESHLG